MKLSKKEKSLSGSITVEFVVILPVLLTLFLFCMDLCGYWGSKFLFRLDVYYLTRSLSMSLNLININSSTNSFQEDKDDIRSWDQEFNGKQSQLEQSSLIHKDKTKTVCDNISKYSYTFDVECLYQDKTLFIKAHKRYILRFFVSRILMDIASIINRRSILDIYEYQSFKMESFLEDSNYEWSGNILGVSSFNNNSKLRTWIKSLAGIYNEVSLNSSKYPNHYTKRE